MKGAELDIDRVGESCIGGERPVQEADFADGNVVGAAYRIAWITA